MSKASKKQARKALIEAARRKEREALLNPSLTGEELEHFQATCDQYFAFFDEVARPCSAPSKNATDSVDTESGSRVGGEILWNPDVAWPSAADGKPLTCVLEVYVPGLPVIPAGIADVERLQVFLELVEPPPPPKHSPTPGLPGYRDGAWHVATHRSGEALTRQSRGLPLECVPLFWERVEKTHPAYPDDLDLIPSDLADAFEDLPNSSRIAAERLVTILGTHVGGWPRWLTGADVGEFIFQLDSETLGVDLGFDGQLYFGLEGESWEMAWEIG